MTHASSPAISLTHTVDQVEKACRLATAAMHFCSLLIKGQKIDAKAVRVVMTRALGGSDNEGLWIWKDAYDAIECGMVLFLKRFAPTMLQHASQAHVLKMISDVQGLCLTQTRRSEESESLQQFSTPVSFGFCAYRAAGIMDTDVVLEPSAGTGLLGVFAHMDAAGVILNEWSPQRAALLSHMFPDVHVSLHNAEQIDDYLPQTAIPSVVLMNPPFSISPDRRRAFADATPKHITSALARLAQGGRLVAITGASFAPDNPRWRSVFEKINQSARVSLSLPVSGKVFAAHGTTIDTRLTVIDKLPATDKTVQPACYPMAKTVHELLALINDAVPPRCAIAEGVVLSAPTPHPVKGDPRRDAVATSSRAATKMTPNVRPVAPDPTVSALTYITSDWKPSETIQEGLYENYEAQSIIIPGAQEHPTKLVQSAAMSSVAGPKPTFQPLLPAHIVSDNALSHPQLESVIYAGEAHSTYITGTFSVDETLSIVTPVDPDHEEAVQFRKGWFLGDGTGIGKGRQVAGIILDNKLNGRLRAVWVSKSDKLIQDAKRDWHAVLIPNDGACLACNFNNIGIHNYKAVDLEYENTLKREPACGTFFQPFGPIELSFINALIADEALAALLVPSDKALIASWLAPKNKIELLDGKWSDDWIKNFGNPKEGAFQTHNEWKQNVNCQICGKVVSDSESA